MYYLDGLNPAGQTIGNSRAVKRVEVRTAVYDSWLDPVNRSSRAYIHRSSPSGNTGILLGVLRS